MGVTAAAAVPKAFWHLQQRLLGAIVTPPLLATILATSAKSQQSDSLPAKKNIKRGLGMKSEQHWRR